MAFPIALPTNVAPEEVFVRRRTAAGVSTSPTSYAQQVYQHPGARWEIDVKLQPMPADLAASWGDFFTALQGRVGTFTMDLKEHCPGVREQFTVDFTGATPAGLANKYVTAADASGAVYAWFNLDAGGVDPAPGGRGIAVAITTGMTAAQIATAFAAALEADAAFTASAASTLATVTDAADGARTDATAGNSGRTVTVTRQGVGTVTFRLAEADPGWSSKLAREFGFSFRAVEDIA